MAIKEYIKKLRINRYLPPLDNECNSEKIIRSINFFRKKNMATKASLVRRLRLNGYIPPVENEYDGEELTKAISLLNEANDTIKRADEIIFNLSEKEKNTFFEVEKLKVDLNQRQMVFCAITTNNNFNDEVLNKSKRGIDIPLVLMLMRWDGLIGFPGGNVEKEESLHSALKRELLEEINYEIDLKDNVQVLCSLSNNERTIHCFTQEVTLDKFKEIIKNSMNATGFLKETQGCFGVQIANFENDFGIKAFSKNNFKGTAFLEFNKLLSYLNNKKS